MITRECFLLLGPRRFLFTGLKNRESYTHCRLLTDKSNPQKYCAPLIHVKLSLHSLSDFSSRKLFLFSFDFLIHFILRIFFHQTFCFLFRFFNSLFFPAQSSLHQRNACSLLNGQTETGQSSERTSRKRNI